MTAPHQAHGNRFAAERMREFSRSAAGDVHRALFSLADEYPHVWVEGTSDYVCESLTVTTQAV